MQNWERNLGIAKTIYNKKYEIIIINITSNINEIDSIQFSWFKLLLILLSPFFSLMACKIFFRRDEKKATPTKLSLYNGEVREKLGGYGRKSK